MVLSGLNYILEKRVEDLLKEEEKSFAPNLFLTTNPASTVESVQYTGEDGSGTEMDIDLTSAARSKKVAGGPNRQDRRFRSKFLNDDKKK